MKRLFSILLSLMILITVTACSNGDKGEIPGSGSTSDNTVSESGTQSKTPSASDTESESTEPDSQPNTDQEEKETMMNIQIGDHLLTAILVENSSTEALIELLKDGPITIDMNDYASMEEVLTRRFRRGIEEQKDKEEDASHREKGERLRFARSRP